MDKEPLTESVRDNIDIEEYDFEFIEQTGILYFLYNKFEVEEEKEAPLK